MNFDDHEIWGAPVRASEATPEQGAATPSSEPGKPGRLYRSAGSEPHPEAILALPNHRRHTAVHPIEPTQWAAPAAPAAPQAPITINSRIPRPIEDPAIAEVLAAPTGDASPATPHSGFTSWFKSPEGESARDSAPLTRVPSAGSDVRNAVAALAMRDLGSRTVALLVFAVSAVVGVVDAVVSGRLGWPTGAALVVSTAFAAWNVSADARWAAWVMPSYTLIAAIIVAGQFTSNAPGASPLGQAMLVIAGLINLAPWLAGATVLGVGIPALHGKRS